MMAVEIQNGLLGFIIILISISGTKSDISNLDDAYGEVYAEVTYRPFPFDMEGLKKTEKDIHLEDCMQEFYVCSSHFNREIPICAKKDEEKRFFHSMCEMMYENCKADNVSHHWHYIDDGIC